ncbi:MAG: GNAT family N-acetyltransferase [Cyanothece sp. SIO1E1]|nr:GNAT family N-acetyltransferase [Cyanothece sp. SIO1E1]
MSRQIRELNPKDINPVICYFLQADHDFLRDIGVEPKKLPNFDQWRGLLLEDLSRSMPDKNFYYLIWELDGCPVGHSNINQIVSGREAYMHLHLWESGQRRHGHGTYFIRESMRRYFENFDLQTLFCEPYALNPAPNKTLAKIGFEFVKTYDTTPGWINFHQTVNRWVLSKEQWLRIST